jgi:D-3-phosphoglycerate dehydrogenase
MVGQITTELANEEINIEEMLNRHHQGLAYNIIDVNQNVTEDQIQRIKEIEGVIRVRAIFAD